MFYRRIEEEESLQAPVLQIGRRKLNNYFNFYLCFSLPICFLLLVCFETRESYEAEDIASRHTEL